MIVEAAAHIHSDWSYDGSWSLESLAVEFKRRGYHAVFITEHDKGFTEERRREHRALCAKFSSDELLVLPGIEYSDAANTIHILVWGDVPFLGEGIPTTELLKSVQRHGGVSVMAHPTRRNAWKLFDPAWIEYLTGIEIWNRKTDGWAPSRTAGPLLLTTKLHSFAGLDFHTERQFFPLAMRLQVEGLLTECSIMKALRSGAFEACAFGSTLRADSLGITFKAMRIPEFGRRVAAGLTKRLTKPFSPKAQPPKISSGQSAS